MPGALRKLELFHQIAHPPSARVRRYLTENALLDQVRLRNIVYPEVQADFAARGGSGLPALWDGEHLLEGADLVLAKLATLVDIGRSS